MERVNELQLGFSEEENQRAIGVIDRLLPHLVLDNFVIVGGLAMRHHLLERGVPYPKRPFNDLDVMIKDMSEMRPSVTQDFLLHHNHQPTYRLLIDTQASVQVDVFDYKHPPVDPVSVQVGNYTVRIRSAEDQFAKAVYDLIKICNGENIPPKQAVSVDLLREISDPEKAEYIWNTRYSTIYPFSIVEAIEKARREIDNFPERVFEHPSRRPEPYLCTECVEEPGFPITPMETVYQLRGYVS